MLQGKFHLGSRALSSPFALCAIVLAIAGCGGSDGDSSNSPPPGPGPANPMVTLTGAVTVDKTVRNAVVCMDLNDNAQCDADEPASARTGGDGVYSLSYDTSKVTADQVKTSSLIAAMVPGAASSETTTIDAGDPGNGNAETRFVLRQVPGKSGSINPLTTLVAAGVASGMSEADARANAAVQLGIAEAKIDNYQDDPDAVLGASDTARMMAKIAAAALEDGATLRVGDLKAARAATTSLASLRYVDFNNVTYRTLDAAARPGGAQGPVDVIDNRGGRGANATPTALYTQAYLTSAGLRICNGSTPITTTSGLPDRSVYCNALPQSGYQMSAVSISGRTMASVVTELQQFTGSNTINADVSPANLISALGGAVFPVGSEYQTRYSVSLKQPVYISNINTEARPASESNFAQLIAARQANNVNLANGASTLSLGVSSGDFRSLSVAFIGTGSATGGTVQFYECTLDATQTTLSACSTTQTGTYSITTENGVRLMRFSGHAPTIMNHTRLFLEADLTAQGGGKGVFRARENKTNEAGSVSASTRLNGTAWAAMKAQLGL